MRHGEGRYVRFIFIVEGIALFIKKCTSLYYGLFLHASDANMYGTVSG